MAIIAADTHLDDGTWLHQQDICGDSRWSFQFIVNLAVDKALPLILAGDVLDVKRPSSDTLDFLKIQCQRLSYLYFIQGQHEMADPPWLQLLLPTAVHLHKTVVPVGGLSIGGLDWTPANKLSEALSNLKPADVYVMHQVWQEFMGSVTSPEGSLGDITCARLVVTGDLHKFQKHYIKRANPLTVYSPGATHMRKINEPSKNFCLILHRDLSVTPVQIPTRKCIQLKLLQEAQLTDLLANFKLIEDKQAWLKSVDKRLPEDLRKPIIRVSYAESLMDKIPVLLNLLAANYHVFTKCLPKEDLYALERSRMAKKLRARGPTGCLSQLVDPKSEDYKVLRRLMSFDDPAAELLKIKREFGL